MKGLLVWLPLRLLKRRLWRCCLLPLLALLLACGLILGLSFIVSRLAAAQGEESQEVLLLIDNSNSMFEKNGVGSDPEGLRIQAAQLFISYLGVDSSGPAHRLGVIFFGGEASLVVPLSPLTDPARRAEIARLIEKPARLSWTNPQAALELALATFTVPTPPKVQRAVILLTDGKPEWSASYGPEEKAAVNARLKETAGRFAAAGIPLFIVLLQSEATDADPEIERVYVPLWQAVATATPPGRFYRARQGEALLDIYHDIVVTLTRQETAGVVLQRQVETETVEILQVEPGLAQITFVIRKSNPVLRVEITTPAGRLLQPDTAGVQYGGRPGQSLEEIWAITDPEPGRWQVRLSGQGTVTLWKDFYPAPATATFTPSPPPTLTPSPRPSPTLTPLPTQLPSATPVPLPSPTLRPRSTPAPTPSPAGLAPLPARPTRASIIWRLGLPLLALTTGGGWWYFRMRQARLQLSGVLRLVSGLPQAASTFPARLDLDSLGRRELRLGPAEAADLTLPGLPPASAIRLVARLGPEGEPEVALRVEGQEVVQVNELVVYQEWPLKDGDLLALGPYRFKYENLRQRDQKYEIRP